MYRFPRIRSNTKVTKSITLENTKDYCFQITRVGSNIKVTESITFRHKEDNNRFIVTHVRSDIKVFDSVILGNKKGVEDSSRSQKAVSGNYIHSTVYDSSIGQWYHLVHHEDCCAKEISRYAAYCQLDATLGDNVFYVENYDSFLNSEDNHSIWFGSGETRVELSLDCIRGNDLFGFMISEDEKGYVWSIGDSFVNEINKYPCHNPPRFQDALRNVSMSIFTRKKKTAKTLQQLSKQSIRNNCVDLCGLPLPNQMINYLRDSF